MSCVLRVHTTRVEEQWCFYVNSWVHTTNKYHNHQLHQQNLFRVFFIPFCRLCKAKRWLMTFVQKSFIHERRSLSKFKYLHNSSYANCYWGGSKMFCAMLWCWICCYPALARSFHGESLTADNCLFVPLLVIRRHKQGLFKVFSWREPHCWYCLFVPLVTRSHKQRPTTMKSSVNTRGRGTSNSEQNSLIMGV